MSLIQQETEQYHREIEILSQQYPAVDWLKNERDGMRQVLIALRVRLRADDRDKWAHVLASIERVLP